jgi:hypothetical protein
MMLYKELDLPPLPTELKDFDYFNFPILKDVKDLGYGGNFVKDGKILSSCSYITANAQHELLTSWFAENLPEFADLKRIYQIQTSCSPTGGTHIVHSDWGRIFGLNYIVDPGGDNVLTSWYKEKNKPLRRLKLSGNRQTDSGAVDYNNLELLESVNFEKHKWYLLATDILHDVDNITGSRRSLSIAFNDTVLLTKMGFL